MKTIEESNVQEHAILVGYLSNFIKSRVTTHHIIEDDGTLIKGYSLHDHFQWRRYVDSGIKSMAKKIIDLMYQYSHSIDPETVKYMREMNPKTLNKLIVDLIKSLKPHKELTYNIQ